MKNTMRSLELVGRDREVIARASRVRYYPLVIDHAKGCEVFDVDGNEYLDFLSSAATLNTGHTHPKVVQAVIRQVEKFLHYTPAYMYHEPQVKLAECLTAITPGDFGKQVVFGLSGSDSADAAIKLSRAYTGRPKIISFVRSYHGSTYGAISLSALNLNMRRKIGPLLPDIEHLPYPDCYRCPYGLCKEDCDMHCIKYIQWAFENYIPPEEVAAVIIEPIQGDAGIIIPPSQFMSELDEFCRERGILFVCDEVQQGFGRTGRWFGIEHFDIVPDMIILGKSIAAGMPLSALVGKKEIMESLEPPAHLFTMGGNPVSCAAALANIQVIEEEGLIENAAIMGDYIRNKLEALKEVYEIIGDIRGRGLSIGVDLVRNRSTRERASAEAAKICYRAWERGLIMTFFGSSVLRIQPPLTISREEIDRGLLIIEESLEDLVAGNIGDEVLETIKGW